MKYLVSVLCLLVAYNLVTAGERFTVVNKCSSGCQFEVVNRMPSKSFIDGTRKITAFRKPVGHTHTCTTCGDTWDHDANSSHTCLKCGGHPPVSRGGGYLADPSPRMIKVERIEQVIQPTTSSASSVVYSIPGISSANCANGQCSTIQQSTKFRLFR